jgi:hypothetical protein
LGCALPPKFVAAAIVAKLPAEWRDFATSIKYKREEISMEDLIAALDVEEKARAKDAQTKNVHNSANFVQKNKQFNKKKGLKQNKTTSFKKKKTEKKDMKNQKMRRPRTCRTVSLLFKRTNNLTRRRVSSKTKLLASKRRK